MIQNVEKNQVHLNSVSKFRSHYSIFSKLLFLLILYFGKMEGAPFQDYLVSIECAEKSSGIALIDAIYLINLDRRPDRLNYINDIFNKYQIQTIRVSACDGKLIPKHVIDQLTGVYHRKNLFQKYEKRDCGAAMGCLLSHLSILQNAFLRDFQIIWVLEDDIKVVGNIAQIPDLLCELFELDPDWDILYTDRANTAIVVYPPDRRPLFSNKNQIEKIGDHFSFIRCRYGTYSMIVSRKGIEKILNYFQLFDFYGPIDNDLHCIPEIRQYSLEADIVTHSNLFKSDIEIK